MLTKHSCSVLCLMLIGCGDSGGTAAKFVRTEKAETASKTTGGSPPATLSDSDEDLHVGLLMLELKVGGMFIYGLAENRSTTKLVHLYDPPIGASPKLEPFFEKGQVFAPFLAKASDDFGNSYKQHNYLPNTTLPHPVHPALGAGFFVYRVDPQDFVLFLLLFENPLEKASQLNIEMPSLVLKNNAMLKFRIPLGKKEISLVPLRMPGAWFEGTESKKTTVLFLRDDAEDWFKKWNKSMKETLK